MMLETYAPTPALLTVELHVVFGSLNVALRELNAVSPYLESFAQIKSILLPLFVQMLLLPQQKQLLQPLQPNLLWSPHLFRRNLSLKKKKNLNQNLNKKHLKAVNLRGIRVKRRVRKKNLKKKIKHQRKSTAKRNRALPNQIKNDSFPID